MINVYNDLMEDTEQTACFYASLFLGLAKQDDTIWQFFLSLERTKESALPVSSLHNELKHLDTNCKFVFK